MSSLLASLKRFDAYPKMPDDFRVRTSSGAAISLLAGLFITALVASEFIYFLSTETNQELFVDTSRSEKMKINVDVVFHKMPCAYLSLDVMDISGQNELDVDHDLFKQRLTLEGKPIREMPETVEELGDQTEGAVHALKEMTEGLDPSRCESCYGAETKEQPCCNTCAEVQEAYRKKGWAFTNADGIAQCEREGWSQKMKEQANEGCRVYGKVEVSKVAGNVHIAPGKSFQQHSYHVHDLQQFGREALAKFNLTHTINNLSFGDAYPGQVNPLAGHSDDAVTPGSTMFQYFVKVVPTRYTDTSGKELHTNQYSVTMHQKQINHDQGQSGLPGVFFMYEISPIVVQLTRESHSFFHFLTDLCGIVGGVFTVAGMLDAFVYHGLRSLKKKQELGKL
eukprot:m.34926 g.34926  ORF g.34926 m.34926 type:complete len:394 (-) comp9832_c0_seq1:231-1412(-)